MIEHKKETLKIPKENNEQKRYCLKTTSRLFKEMWNSNLTSSTTTLNSYKKDIYCKKCGGKLDNNKQCLQCQKKYFKVNRNFIITTLLSVFLVIAIITIFIFQFQLKTLKSNLIQKENELKVAQEKADEFSKKYFSERWDNISKENFFDNAAVIVCNDGTNKYHKYGCEDLNLSYFWIYNTEAAIDKGYIMCKKCN